MNSHRVFRTEKFPGSADSKEGHADNLPDVKGPITIEFSEKGAIVNSTSYCKLLRQLVQ